MENEELLNRLQNLENKNSDKYTMDKYKEVMGNFFDGAEQLLPVFYNAVEDERNNYIAKKLNGDSLEPFNEKAVTNALLNKLADDNNALAKILKTLTDRTKDVVEATKDAINPEETADTLSNDLNSDVAGDLPPEGVDMNTAPAPQDTGALVPPPMADGAGTPPMPDMGGTMPPLEPDTGSMPQDTGAPVPSPEATPVPQEQLPPQTAVSDRRLKTIIRKPRYSREVLRTALSDFRMKNVKKPVGEPISSNILSACMEG